MSNIQRDAMMGQGLANAFALSVERSTIFMNPASRHTCTNFSAANLSARIRNDFIRATLRNLTRTLTLLHRDVATPGKGFSPCFFSCNLNTYILKYLHTYILTYLHTYILTYLHTYILTYINTYIPTYLLSYLHTYILTYLHTYIHT